jgi:hypothetical protein
MPRHSIPGWQEAGPHFGAAHRICVVPADIRAHRTGRLGEPPRPAGTGLLGYGRWRRPVQGQIALIINWSNVRHGSTQPIPLLVFQSGIRTKTLGSSLSARPFFVTKLGIPADRPTLSPFSVIEGHVLSLPEVIACRGCLGSTNRQCRVRGLVLTRSSFRRRISRRTVEALKSPRFQFGGRALHLSRK